VQPPVAAAEVEQGVQARIEACLDDLSDKDVMVAAVIDCVPLAFEHAERIFEDRRAGLPT
jgi:hypothetical protein